MFSVFHFNKFILWLFSYTFLCYFVKWLLLQLRDTFPPVHSELATRLLGESVRTP